MLPKELIRRIRRLEIATRKVVSALLAGQYHSVFKGRGMAFSEVRQYQPGRRDPHHRLERDRAHERRLREGLHRGARAHGRCCWWTSRPPRSSARAERREVGGGRGGGRADRLLGHRQQRPGGAASSSRTGWRRSIPPRKGRKHVLRLVSDILTFRPEGKGTDLAAGLSCLSRVAKRRTVPSWSRTSSPRATRGRCAPSAASTTSCRWCVRDPLEEAFPALGLVELEDPETGERLRGGQLVDPRSAGPLRSARWPAHARSAPALFRSWSWTRGASRGRGPRQGAGALLPRPRPEDRRVSAQGTRAVVDRARRPRPRKGRAAVLGAVLLVLPAAAPGQPVSPSASSPAPARRSTRAPSGPSSRSPWTGRSSPGRSGSASRSSTASPCTTRRRQRCELRTPRDLGGYELIEQSRTRSDGKTESTTTYLLKMALFELGSHVLPTSPSTWWTPPVAASRASTARTSRRSSSLPKDADQLGAKLCGHQAPTRTSPSAAGGSSGGWPARSPPLRWSGCSAASSAPGRRRLAAAPPLLPLDVRTRQALDALEARGPPRARAASASSTSGCRRSSAATSASASASTRWSAPARSCSASCGTAVPRPGVDPDALSGSSGPGAKSPATRGETSPEPACARALGFARPWCRPPGRAPAGSAARSAPDVAPRDGLRSARTRRLLWLLLLVPLCSWWAWRGAAHRVAALRFPAARGARRGRARGLRGLLLLALPLLRMAALAAGGDGPRPAPDARRAGAGPVGGGHRHRRSRSTSPPRWRRPTSAPTTASTWPRRCSNEFIASRVNDRIGLVVFAGAAYTQAPLTLDYGVLTRGGEAAAHPRARGRHRHRRRARRLAQPAARLGRQEQGGGAHHRWRQQRRAASRRWTPRGWRRRCTSRSSPSWSARAARCPSRRARTCSATPS